MKKDTLNTVARTFSLLTLATLGSTAFAAQTWNLNAACAPYTGTSTSQGLATGYCGADLSMSGWSSKPASSSTVEKFASAKVYDWGTWGLGVVATSEDPNATGPHATDNKSGTDAFLFNFTNSINLTSLRIGWNGTDNSVTGYTDSDLTVLVWTGADAPVMTNVDIKSASSFAAALTAGWKLVGNFGNVGANANNSQSFSATNSNGTALYSKYWLVSAYNAAYGGSMDTTVDAFKLLSLSADICGGSNSITGTSCGNTNVPEPGSLALLGAGLLGMMAVRRRKANATL